MPRAQGFRTANALAARVSDIDPFSHETTAAAVQRLTSLVEAQARIIRNYESALARSKEIFERASSAARLGMWECDLTTETLEWSGGTYDMFDIPRDSPLVRKQTLPCYPAESLKALEAIRSRAIAQRNGFNLDSEIVTARGNRRWIRITATVECAGDRAVRLFGIKQDITEEKAKWERLRYLAEADELTGLANRSCFRAKLSEFCEAPALSTAGALMLLDLDGFKEVNDSLGHAAGDECLKEAAHRLSAVCAGAVVIARIGGDEFAVLLGPGAYAHRITTTAVEFIRSMNRPLEYHGHRFKIGASVGIAAACGCTSVELFHRADAALYAAKAAGRNTFRWFDPLALVSVSPRRPPPGAPTRPPDERDIRG